MPTRKSTPPTVIPLPVQIALDRGDHEMHAAILPPGAARPVQEIFKTGAETLHGFVRRWQQAHPGHLLEIAFEQPAPGLLHALMDLPGVELYPMNPSQTARYREVLHSSRKKDDATDALVILELLKTHRQHFPKWEPESPSIRRLRLLVEGRRKAVNDRTDAVLSLISLLKIYYPQALELCGENMSKPMTLAFLKRWPTLQALKQSSAATIRAFYYGQHVRRGKAIKARLLLLEKAEPLTHDAPMLEACEMRLGLLLDQIRTLNVHVTAYEKQIAELASAQPQHAILQSFPGVGPVIGARLMAALGSQKENLPHAVNLACLSGIAPIIKRSGKSTSTQRRMARPVFLHQTFMEFAESSIKSCLWAQAFFRLKRAQGKGRWASVRALAYKWIRILHQCWTHDIPYDENRYVAQLRLKGSPLLPYLDQLLAAPSTTSLLNKPTEA
jgi:transposase